MFTFGIYVNQYIFRLFTPTLILAGCLLPWLGFFLGGLVAFILRQPFDRITTIAIETGIQNSGEIILSDLRSLWIPSAFEKKNSYVHSFSQGFSDECVLCFRDPDCPDEVFSSSARG